jgi:hypothetical protein
VFDAEADELVGAVETERITTNEGPIVADGAVYVAGGVGDSMALERYA